MQAIASFVLLPIITKHLSTSDYGIYILINMIGLISGTVFYLGITSALPRSYFDYSEESERNSVLSTGFFIILIGATTQTLLGVIFGDKISFYFFKTAEYSFMIKTMLFAAAVGFINSFFQTYFRLLSKSVVVISQGAVASLVNFFVAIYLFQATNLNIFVPILSFLASQSIIFLHSLYLSKNHIIFKFCRKEAILMLRFGVPTVLVSFTMMAFEWSDRFFLNKYLTLAEVGIYSFAYKFGTLINPLLIAPFGQIWNPLMMKYKDSDDIQLLTNKVLTLYFAIGSFFCLVATSYLDELIKVFVKNTEFHKGLYLMPIIMASILAFGTNNITNAGFLYKRKVTEVSIICFIFAILSLITGYLLIPQMGKLGAALSTFIVYTLLSLALYLRGNKYFKITPDMNKVIILLLINFGFIYLNNAFTVDSQLIRILVKTSFIMIGFILTAVVILGKNTLLYLTKPELIVNFLFKKEQI